MNTDQDNAQAQPKEHLRRLRDFLDLPFNTLGDGELSFLLADECHVLASYTKTGHISLICDIAKLDALSADDWRGLLIALSGAHDYEFPASLVPVNGRLALIWGCDAGMETDRWIRRVEDALTCALGILARMNEGSASSSHPGASAKSMVSGRETW